jgi:hypothetical protein
LVVAGNHFSVALNVRIVDEAWPSGVAAAPVYLEDVNDRGVVMLVTRHRDQSKFSRYFYPWSVVGWIRLAEDDERAEPQAEGSS